MSQWAREHPEAMAEIAAAPLPRHNALLADAQRHYGGELDKADTPAPPIIDRSEGSAQIAASIKDDRNGPAGWYVYEDENRYHIARAHGGQPLGAQKYSQAEAEARAESLNAEKAQVAAVEQFDADIAAEQKIDHLLARIELPNADRGLRERGQQILDRLDHTAEDMLTDQDDDALDAAEGEGRR